MTGPRDWDKELAAVDKAIQKMKAPLNPTPASGTPVARQPVPAAAPREPQVSRRGKLATWLRVVLVLLLGVAAPFWPYPRQCGLNLFLYLGVIGLVVIAGIWGAASSWNRRLGLPHVLSVLTIIWGLALIAAEVLPRVGYAAISAAWGC
jgi:hypothetical protein